MRLIYSEKARLDLDGILDSIAVHAPGTAVRFVEQLIGICELIRTHPEMGHLNDAIAPGIREFVYRKYVIYYRYHKDDAVVRISRVLHHALDHSKQSID